jgi:hypothetical protein
MLCLILLVSRWVVNHAWTKFWHDVWCGEYSLKETFPEFFCIGRGMDVLVADHMFAHCDKVDWDMNFIQLVEVDAVSSLFNALYSVRLGRGDEDKFCSILSKR